LRAKEVAEFKEETLGDTAASGELLALGVRPRARLSGPNRWLPGGLLRNHSGRLIISPIAVFAVARPKGEAFPGG
jgi:hypothetical protein